MHSPLQRLDFGKIPILVASAPPGSMARRDLCDLFTGYLIKNKMHSMICGGIRGVSIERLPYILKHGCDVDPTDSVMYIADGLDKALEYGADGDQVIQFFGKHLEQTFKEVPVTTPQAELEAMSAIYPTRLTVKDGQYYWLSRLPPDHPGLASGYEIAYARWIRVNPFQSLKGLLIIGVDYDKILNRTQALLGEISGEA